MPLLWVGFYGKQTLRWCLVWRMLIKECSWYQNLWKGGEGAEEEAKLWSWPSVSPIVSSGAKMACQSCPPLGWKSQSFWPWVRQGQLRQPLKGLAAFPVAGATLLPWRGIWTSHGHLLKKSYLLFLLANWALPSTLTGFLDLALFFHSTNHGLTYYITY